MQSSFDKVEQVIERLGLQTPDFPCQELRLDRVMRHTMTRITGKLNERLQHFDINDSIWYALLVLYVQPERALYPSDISEVLHTSRTHASRISHEVEKNGWVLKLPCVEDRRKTRLKLTRAGVAFIESVIPRTLFKLDEQWNVFSLREKDLLEQILRKLLLVRHY